MTADIVHVKSDKLEAYCRQYLVMAGADTAVADDVSWSLIQTSLRGIDSHGIVQLPKIVERVKAGRSQINSPATFVGGHSSSNVKVLDANLTPGQHSCLVAARHAADLAEKAGIAMISVRNSTHFGACTPYVIELSNRHFVAIAGSNSTQSMAAFGADFANLGNNPFGFAVPVADGEDIVFDSSSAVMSFGRLAKILADTGELPPSAFIKNKKASVGDNVYEIAGDLEYLANPFGGYKGASIAILIEVLSGILSGGNFGRNTEISDGVNFRGPSHFVIAIHPEFFDVGNLAERMSKYLDDIKQGSSEVRLPGASGQKIKQTRERQGIPVSTELMSILQP